MRLDDYIRLTQFPISIRELSSTATGRSENLFLVDLESRKFELSEKIKGTRILVIGGAGSIGRATVHALLKYQPQSLHVIDLNENGLAELIRDLRSSAEELPTRDIRMFPLDFGSSVTHRLLRESPSYDHVLNFAAIKHVRSEKDTCSVLQMLDTNVFKLTRLLGWLAGRGEVKSFFCVSTDKAANPTSLMGASKRIMEHIIFSHEIVDTDFGATSARFANVAFSDGGLLDSFLKRISRRQPLALPQGVRRYFISLEEAACICLLAAFCLPHGHILVPRLDAERHLVELESVGVKILQRLGFKPHFYTDELEAKKDIEGGLRRAEYPVLLTSLDTSGEKSYEEFVGAGETLRDVGMSGLLALTPHPIVVGVLSDFLNKVKKLISDAENPTTKEELVQLIATIVTELHHTETGKDLDQRM